MALETDDTNLRIDIKISDFKPGLPKLAVTGDLDEYTASILSDRVMTSTGERGALVDLSEATFVDSAGYAALVSLNKRMVEINKGLAVVCSPENEPVHHALEVLHFDKWLSPDRL